MMHWPLCGTVGWGQIFDDDKYVTNEDLTLTRSIEKKKPPILSHGLGHLEIRKYSEV